MFYEFTMVKADGTISHATATQDEFYDMIAYCQEGTSAGWLLSYDYESIIEEY